ncbi:MAG TPA: sugar phosphate isomerase/epimerase family protein [Phycisphaerae bacterium]|nr:sugar phosphate isomerase/epimerase family protein [Phycisphaerae bacterium]
MPKFAYVLPDPLSYTDWVEFEEDLACVKQAGYGAVELQIADPAAIDEPALRSSLGKAGLPMCAFQTGSSYSSCGNCLCTPDAAIRNRTVKLLKSFVDFASRLNAVIVFGSLQGRTTDEPDTTAGRKRIVEAIGEVCRYATKRGVTVCMEPVNHLETAYHNTIREVERLVRSLNTPSARMMIDTFHMNIEEKDMTGPIAPVADILAHVHLSDTNRDVLGAGHWDTAAFLRDLRSAGYAGYCSVGVYNTRQSRKECMRLCMKALKQANLSESGRRRS